MSLLRSRAKQRMNICASNPFIERLLAWGLNVLPKNLCVHKSLVSRVKKAFVFNLVSAQKTCRSSEKKAFVFNLVSIRGTSQVGSANTSPLVGEVCFQCENLSIRKQGEGEYQCKNEKCKTFTVIASEAKQSSHHHYVLDPKPHAVIDTASQKQETFACTRLDCHTTNVARSDAIFTVMLNLFPHLTSLQYSFQAYEILNLSWIIRVLAGVTSRSNLRARLRRRPTENPQVQDDNLTKEGLLCFP